MTTEKTGATAERFLPESEVRRVVNDGRNFPFATICTQRAVGEAIEQIPRVNVKTIRYGPVAGRALHSLRMGNS